MPEQCDPNASVTEQERLPLDDIRPANIDRPFDISNGCGGHVENKKNSPVAEYS
jgi:hypothetical protein